MSQDNFDLAQARLCVIMNLGSGKDENDELVEQVTTALKPRAAEFSLRQISKGSDLVKVTKDAVADGFDVIVALGGDGTQAAVAGVLSGTDTIMGVLPGGTFNYFARDLGVGENLKDALETLQSARVEQTDLAEINGLVFLNNVSLGVYPHILKTRESIYKRWGRSRIAAYISVLVALRRLGRPMTLTTKVDGEAKNFTTTLVFVAHSAFQLESFGLEGSKAIRNGKFAVLIARARKPLPLMRSAFRLAVGLSAQNSDFDLILTDEIKIETKKQQLVAYDGEKTKMTPPFTLKVRPDALRLLLPANCENKTESGKK